MGRVVEHAATEEIFEHPKHPYTQALMQSIPGLGMARKTRLQTIAGSRARPVRVLARDALFIRAVMWRKTGCATRATGRNCDLRAMGTRSPACFANRMGAMGHEDALLRVRDLKKHFPITGGFFNAVVGQVKAVDGVSFDLFEGECLGLVGRKRIWKNDGWTRDFARADPHGWRGVVSQRRTGNRRRPRAA